LCSLPCFSSLSGSIEMVNNGYMNVEHACAAELLLFRGSDGLIGRKDVLKIRGIITNNAVSN
jgi:hypothetical protein